MGTGIAQHQYIAYKYRNNMDKLTEVEIAAYKKIFDRLDRCTPDIGNGCIHAMDLRTVYTHLKDKAPTQAELQAFSNGVETEADGTIRFDAFCELMYKNTRNERGAKNAEIAEAFAALDPGNSGKIPVNEIRRVLEQLGGELSQGEIDEMVREADRNADGQIDYIEFLKMLQN